MDQKSIQRITGAGAALLLMLLAASTLAFGDDSDDAALIGEPLDEARKEEYRGTALEFIAETGWIIYNERGGGQIIWDPPDLPTVRESVRMYREAVARNDTNLIPLCSKSFLRYLKAAEGEDESLDSDDPYFPACQAIPSGIYFGPPDGPSGRSSGNDHSG